MQNFNQTEIRQIPIQCRRRSSATFLDRMHGKLDRNSTGIAHAFLGAFHCFQMPPVTRRQITADLSNPDDRPSGLQFLPRQSIVQIPLHINRGHARIVGIIKPIFTTEFLAFTFHAATLVHPPYVVSRNGLAWVELLGQSAAHVFT